MKKAVLSNRIYLSVDFDLEAKINEELTYAIPSYNPNDPPLIMKNVAKIREGLISFPIGRTDLIPADYEIVDKRLHVPANFPEFQGKLRPSQELVYEQVDDNAIINAWVSWGKTFTGLSILKKLGQKSLVIVHQVPLRNQWVRECEKVFGFTPGIIGSGKFEVDTPIVIGNVQTLYRRPSEIKKMFGTIMVDEVHHIPAKTFSTLVDSSYARYKLGLSGTLERKDQKHVVMKDYFGSKILQPPRENYMVPKVEIINTPIRFLDGNKMPWAHRVNELCNNEDYFKLITLLAATYHRRGHKVLLVSDRVAFLKKCARVLGDYAVCITGEIPHEERDVLMEEITKGRKTILCGTKAIFSEGISLEVLSCLILATPINNDPLLTQLIGRVIREHPKKPQPVIVDIHLKGNTARRQASNRMAHYMKAGYHVKSFMLQDRM
jgi:superfamily II DNA or RNA helicase